MSTKILAPQEFTPDLAAEFYNSSKKFPVLFDNAYQWLGYSSKGNAKKSFLKCGFIENIDYQVVLEDNLRPQGGFSNQEVISLTSECLKTWGMLSKTEKGKQIRLYFLECEAIAKEAIKCVPVLQQEVTELKHTVLVISQTQEEKLNQALSEALPKAIAIHTQNILQQAAVQQNDFAIQLWQRFNFEFENRFNKVRQEWLNFYEKYKSQEQELEALKVEFDVFFHGKVEGVAPGWNVEVWRQLSRQDKLEFWKKHKLNGWEPSDQFQAQFTNILPPAPVEKKILESQHEELKQIMSAPTSAEAARIEELKNRAFKNLDENFKSS